MNQRKDTITSGTFNLLTIGRVVISFRFNISLSMKLPPYDEPLHCLMGPLILGFEYCETQPSSIQRLSSLRERFIEKKEKITDKCLFCPYTYLRTVKTDIFLFFIPPHKMRQNFCRLLAFFSHFYPIC